MRMILAVWGCAGFYPLKAEVTAHDSKNSSDEELMEQIKQGQTEALALLFDRHYRLVYSVALRILHDHAEAEDLMQDVFLEIYRKIEKYDQKKGSAKTWILQYAYHRSLNRQKYLALRNSGDFEEVSEFENWELKHSNSQWNGLSFEEWGHVLKKGFSLLNEKERKTLDLVYFQGLLLKEIAAELKEPLGNIRNHYYRGLKKMRDFLTEQSEQKS
jgi:RNA polymerase sigma-70 factor (ECF subfamily)